MSASPEPLAPFDAAAPGPRVAIVHEWLASYAGSERVVEQMLEVYPHADLFAVVDFVPPGERAFLMGKTPTTTFVQRLPFARTRFRAYLPLMPLAIEQLDLSAYDVVLSSNHAVAKGVVTGPDQVHVCYVHSPLRYAWDLQHQYLRESGLARGIRSWLARGLLHYLRQWDARSANGVDLFLANSAYIGRRVHKAWRRDAEVLFPPVDVDAFAMRRDKGEAYLTASRMVPYKRVPLIVEAFARMPKRKLVVIGDGAEFAKAKAMARGAPNIELLGHQPHAALVERMQRARAFVFAAEEDFGITAVEAQACGTPVIAFGRGGARETVVEHLTGLFFHAQTVDAIVDAVERFEAAGAWSADACRRNAERFAPTVFRTGLRHHVDRAWADACAGLDASAARPPGPTGAVRAVSGR